MLRTAVVDVVALDIGNLERGLTVTTPFQLDRLSHHSDRNPTCVEDYLIARIVFRAPVR
jgi:hypothetical protein